MATSRYTGGAGGSRGRGVLNFTIDTRGAKGFRIPKGQPGAGRFTSAQTAFRGRNERLAARVQAQVVNNIAERIVRRSVSSGRLLKVTADPRNRDVDQFGFSVGIESYLDSSIAKYWRTIEEGSATVWADVPTGRPSMIGLPLNGFWGGSILGMSGNRVYGGKPWSKHSSRRGDKFIPIPNGKLSKVTEVKNEIEPMWAYRDAFESIGVARRSRANMSQFLADVGAIELPPSIE